MATTEVITKGLSPVSWGGLHCYIDSMYGMQGCMIQLIISLHISHKYQSLLSINTSKSPEEFKTYPCHTPSSEMLL